MTVPQMGSPSATPRDRVESLETGPGGARLKANLAALRSRQAEVAESIAACDMPQGVVAATGRDGSLTARLPGAGGRMVWFGESSMPGVSSESQFVEIAYPGGNVSLPSIMTGREVLTLANRLPPHAAIFVFEPSLALIRVAFHLHDYTGLIESGRLVLVHDEDRPEASSTSDRWADPTESRALAASFELFWGRFPGYDIPSFLFNAPSFSPSRMAEIQRRIEVAAEAIVRLQQERLASAIRVLCERGIERSDRSGPRAIAVVSADARLEALSEARRIHAAAGNGRPRVLCVPDRPEHCHVVARAGSVAAIGAETVLVVGAGFEVLRGLLPESVLMVWWAVEGEEAPASTIKAMGVADAVVVSCESARAAATALMPPGLVVRLEPAADATVFCPPGSAEPRWTPTCDAVILYDVPDDRPESCQVVLPSHLALWSAMREVVREESGSFDEHQIAHVLAEAQRRTHAPLRDESIRTLFERTLRERIAPAIVARDCARELARAGLAVHVYGANWSIEDLASVVHRGPIPEGPALRSVFLGTRLTVTPWSSAGGVRRCLESLACGTPAALRLSSIPFEKEYPGLTGLRAHLHVFRGSRELVELARHGKRWADGPNLETSAAVMREHTTAARLAELERLLARRVQ